LGILLVMSCAPVAIAGESQCESCQPVACVGPACVADDAPPSWVFRRSTYTHDPLTGARVAQYMRIPPVEPLEDERNVTSRYRRSRTTLRGADGSSDTYYEVQAWGNGRGGLDAEWERFHDAWKESYLQGGYYNGPVYGGGYPGPWGYGNGGYGYPGYGFPGGWGGPGNWGPHGRWPNHGGHGQHGNGDRPNGNENEEENEE
jgi:hypothetical protein